MEERRRFGRCEVTDTGYLDLGHGRCEVKVLDISAGGMRVATEVPLHKDVTINGEFKILSNIGPFFVKGKVLWSVFKENTYEAGISFDKVSTIPFA